MKIKKYSKADETLLFDLLIDEGDDWIEYHGPAGRSKYVKALESSITYIAYHENLVCGYARCREDDGFGVYITHASIQNIISNEVTKLIRMPSTNTFCCFISNHIFLLSDLFSSPCREQTFHYIVLRVNAAVFTGAVLLDDLENLHPQPVGLIHVILTHSHIRALNGVACCRVLC